MIIDVIFATVAALLVARWIAPQIRQFMRL